MRKEVLRLRVAAGLESMVSSRAAEVWLKVVRIEGGTEGGGCGRVGFNVLNRRSCGMYGFERVGGREKKKLEKK
jgi:hypothetical protein